MPIDYHRHLKSHGRILAFFIGACIIVGTLIFLLPGADRDLASASQERQDSQATGRDRDEEQARKDERDKRRPDHFVRSRPKNVVWGGFPINRTAVLTMQSGQTVRIDALSQSGATGMTSPVEFFALFGVKSHEVLPDLVDFWKTIPNGGGMRPRYGPHILTGPVYIDGAAPGDTLEIQILDINLRVPYGVNNTSPMGGVLGTPYPGFRTGDTGLNTIPMTGTIPNVRQHLYRATKVRGRDVAVVADGVQVPLAPFMGVMGVAPETGVFVQAPANDPNVLGVQSSWPPGPFGGNMDLKDLTAGAKLFLPVFQFGAQFYTGDSHSAQGDGEVSGTAIEHSLSGVFRFILHKGRTLDFPRAETATHYIMMGTDLDLDRAMRKATLEAVKFLVTEKGLTEAKAFSLASIGIDFHVAEVVDTMQLVSARIPKSLFVKDSRDDDERKDR
jgi:acetamidase/formamidase